MTADTAPANAKNVTPKAEKSTNGAVTLTDQSAEHENREEPPTAAGIAEANEQASREVLALSPVKSQIKLTETDKATIHGLITAQLGEQGKSVTPFEFAYFIRVAELRGLNPLFREVHLIKDRDGRITAQTGIDGFRKLAEETDEYRGQTAPEWGPSYDGTVADWIGRPGYVRIGVHRKGFDEPVWGEAWLEEDGQVKNTGEPIAQWKTRPRTMLAKVAEARGLRKAFPRHMAGLYTDDEIPGTEAPFVPPDTTRPPPPPAAPPNMSSPASPAAQPAQNAPGPAQPAQAAPTAAPTAAARPATTDGLQGTLEKVEDLRQTRPSGQLATKYGVAGEGHQKLELKFKVGGKNHTAMLFDDIAEQAALLELRASEVIYVRGGTVEEFIWQEGKPPKKEVWGATEVFVLRNNDWVSAATAVPPAMPLADPPGRGPASTSPAPTPITPPSSSSPAPAAMSSSPSPVDDPEEPPFESLATTKPTPAPVKRKGANDEIASLHVRLAETPHWGTAGGSRPYVGAKLIVLDGTGELVDAACGGEDMEPCFGTESQPLWREGDEVVAIGSWQNGWLIVSAMGAPGPAS